MDLAAARLALGDLEFVQQFWPSISMTSLGSCLVSSGQVGRQVGMGLFGGCLADWLIGFSMFFFCASELEPGEGERARRDRDIVR